MPGYRDPDDPKNGPQYHSGISCLEHGCDEPAGTSVEAYLHHEALTPDHIAALRAYLRQWIFAPAWRGDGIAELRERIDGLTTRETITAWLDDAERIGIDPL